ncbi:MAG TPA: hypothetical protein VF614_15380, partial [Chthoniobacteraceae bacterium]
MAARIASHTGRPALEMIEEATRLLRRAPIGVILAYYIGSVPCILGLLYFVVDMSRGAFAHEHLPEAALGAAALYLWMKCWHAIFARGLQAALAEEPPVRWTFGQVWRLAIIQVAVQPTGLFFRPIAAQFLLPYVWVYSFYQNVGVLGDGRAPLGEVLRDSARQARLWPAQAHYALLYRYGFATIVWLNAAIFTLLAPQLLKMFFGIETIFTQNLMGLVNTTLIAAITGVTYLCTDPLRKALYVLRCFHGTAVHSGDDLLAELKRLRKPSMAAAAAILLLLGLAGAQPAHAAEPEPTPVRVNSSELNRSIDDVLQRREFAWRLPQERDARPTEKGWLTSFVEDVSRSIGKAVSAGIRMARDFMDWVKRFFKRSDNDADESSGGWNLAGSARWVTYSITALAVLGLIFAFWRYRKARKLGVLAAQPVNAAPDLTSDDIVADQLPEEGWLRLARELHEAGDLRLALRASYLAGLAHLGSRDL